MIARNLLFASLKGLTVLLLFIVSFQARSASLYLSSGARGSQDGWHLLRERFQLVEHYSHKAVAKELGRFSQAYFNRLRSRIVAHQGFLNSEVGERKVPAELALLPLIESALDGNAISPARAAGVWQFMPETARACGLKVTRQSDDRKDIVKATEAALNLLEDLYDQTGDWLLAIAAYNVGAGRIQRAITKAAVAEPDFWQLSLPRETRQFVARLLALSKVVYAPEQHGLRLPALKPANRMHAGFRETEPEFWQEPHRVLWMDQGQTQEHLQNNGIESVGKY